MATLTLLLQLLSLTTISLILLANAQQVDNVCGQTRDPPLCKMSLTSDPRSETAPLPSLAQITDDMAGYRANAIKHTIDDSMSRTADPTLRGQYVQCQNLYLDALEELFRAAPERSRITSGVRLISWACVLLAKLMRVRLCSVTTRPSGARLWLWLFWLMPLPLSLGTYSFLFFLHK
ncbi:hypothetical protein CASFOL_015621 [Castilleja foliolosa]|uniref:Pectinesterase inhibitor domain-containing protein n=1 Tax=Castilleja foliolosa TaxID=1961234 RepID=A0ABD3DET4_9LAMI